MKFGRIFLDGRPPASHRIARRHVGAAAGVGTRFRRLPRIGRRTGPSDPDPQGKLSRAERALRRRFYGKGHRRRF